MKRALLLVLLGLSQAHPALADQLQALAGAENHDMGHQVLAFLPNELWIHEGDSVTWSFPTAERHTVSFLTPGQVRQKFQVGCPGSVPSGATYIGTTCVNSDVLMNGQTYTVTFPQHGNFKLACLVHLYMTGVVHVLDAAEILPHDQQYYDREAERERRELLSDADGLEGRALVIARRTSDTEVAAGISDVVATTGGGVHGSAVMRFLRDRIEVHVGDTVEWTNISPGVNHTVTFGTEPSDPFAPPSSNVTTDLDGALHSIVGSPTDSVHSGLFGPAPGERVGAAQTPLGVTRFRVTFTAPGTFRYICALHDDEGMVGTVVVRR
ncbi:MAG TPA: plastocyanin/azurin family copper-binding protein [Vicinamibacterales bacterium]